MVSSQGANLEVRKWE